jgi:hypothetical protein
MPQKPNRKRDYMREYMRKRRAQTVCPPVAPPALPRVICSACRYLAATFHHCIVRKDIRIANSDNSIECDSYRPR